MVALRLRQGVVLLSLFGWFCVGGLGGSGGAPAGVVSDLSADVVDHQRAQRFHFEISGFASRISRPAWGAQTSRARQISRRVSGRLIALLAGNHWVELKTPLHTRVTLRNGGPVAVGDIIEVTLDLHPLDEPLNAGEPTPKELHMRRRVDVGVRQVSQTYALAFDSGGFVSWVNGARDALAAKMERHLRGDLLGVGKALSLGDRGDVSLELRERWGRAGIVHLLAISGLHIGLVAAFAFYVLGLLVRSLPPLLRIWPAQRWAATLTLPLTMLFALWSGLGFSAIRAATMASAVLFALALGRRSKAANALGLAGVGILIVDPTAVWDVGFMLSFAAAAALSWLPGQRRLQLVLEDIKESDSSTWARFANRGLSTLKQSLVVSLVATLATAPVLALRFFEVSLISPLANVIAVPLAALLLTPASLITALLLSFELTEAASVTAFVAEMTLRVIDEIARFATGSVWAVASAPITGDLDLGLMLLFVCAALLYIVHPRPGLGFDVRRDLRLLRRTWLFLALSALALLGWRGSRDHFAGRFAVLMPYVGQGDAAVVHAPNGYTALVDTGPPRRAYAVAGALRTLGTKTIDLVVISHAQRDHAGALGLLADRFTIRELWYASAGTNSRRFLTLLHRLRRKGTIIKTVDDLPPAGTWSGLEYELYRPVYTHQIDISQNSNEQSIVLRLNWGQRSVLFSGDIGVTTEERLLPLLTNTEILKVPHHGSDTSSSGVFIDALNPQYALISAGVDNRFGHPSSEVVERYKSRGINVLQTPKHGAIAVSTTGERWEVETFR